MISDLVRTEHAFLLKRLVRIKIGAAAAAKGESKASFVNLQESQNSTNQSICVLFGP